MTKDKYIRMVKKKLFLPNTMKATIISNLNETFESGIEHGGTDESIIEYLGSPDDFVKEITISADLPSAQLKRIRQVKIFQKLLCVSLIFMAIFSIIKNTEIVKRSHMIGYTNVPVEIFVYNGIQLDFPLLLLFVFILLSVIFFVCLLLAKKQAKC